MIRCGFCPRTFSKQGLQEQLSLLEIHVKDRHPRQSKKTPPSKWYREEPMEGEAPAEKPMRDAGDVATQAKWQLGAAGVLVIVLDGKGAAHIGASGLSPMQVREMACAAIHASFVQALKQQSPVPAIPIIGGKA